MSEDVLDWRVVEAGEFVEDGVEGVEVGRCKGAVEDRYLDVLSGRRVYVVESQRRRRFGCPAVSIY